MNFTQEYAHLQHEYAIYVIHNAPVPPHITQRMIEIEAWGRANLTHQQQQAAVNEKNRILANLHLQHAELNRQYDTYEQQQAASVRTTALDKAVGNLTRGMLGEAKLTPAQLAAVVQKKPLRARIPDRLDKRTSSAQNDAQMRLQSRHMDPKGLGWGVKEFTERMDELAAASPKQFAQVASKFAVPIDVDQVSRWKTARIRQGLNERMRSKRHGEAELGPILNKDRPVADSEHRKAVLATAFLADAQDHASHGDYEMIDDLNDDGRRGVAYEEGRRSDLALAWDKVEG